MHMQKIMLPSISFAPPSTIKDAMAFFQKASVELDNPELPDEKRGLRFLVKSKNNSEKGDLPQIPKLSAQKINLYSALQLVCESVGYTFEVHNGCVYAMPK